MRLVVTFEVPGEPRGKGRPRFHRTGKYVSAYTDSETKAYENKILAYYQKATGGYRFPDAVVLEVEITAYYPIPKSATKAATAAMRDGTAKPTKKPDLDNVVKIVLDALNAVAYKDDSMVVRITARKEYSDFPRIQITLKGCD